MAQDIKAEDIVLEQALSSHYDVDYYQREYAWGEKEVLELLDDLWIKFNESYNDGDEPSKVPEYKQYFLGSFVLSSKSSKNYIIDGQQRLTTLSLLFMHIFHRSEPKGLRSKDAKNLVFSDNLGEEEFNINAKERIPAMQYILHGRDNKNAPESVTNNRLVENYSFIESYFTENIDDSVLLVFYYWLRTRVLMVRIIAYEEEEAYTIFESMNDRGKPLDSIDMLKGYLLSMVDEQTRYKAVELWKKSESKFVDKHEFSDFLVDLFRAKWAKTTIQSVKNAARKEPHKVNPYKNDWTEISTHFHRFIKENKSNDRINLNSSERIMQILREIDYYSDYSFRLSSYIDQLTDGFEDIFYVSKAGMPHIKVMLYGLVDPFDEHEKQKTKIIARFLDLRAGLYAWNTMDLSNDVNTSAYIVSVLSRVRTDLSNIDDSEVKCSVLAWFFYNEIKSKQNRKHSSWGDFSASNPPVLSTKKYVKSQIFYALARFSSLLDTYEGKPNTFRDFYENKHEIEHVLASDFIVNKAFFTDQEELDYVRDQIGGLGLLSKSINSSFRDKSYVEKVKKYPQHSAYLGVLCESLYNSNGSFANRPGLNSLVRDHPDLKSLLTHYPSFDRKVIQDRNSLASKLASIVWNAESLSDFRDKELFESFSDLEEYSDLEFEEEYEPEEEDLADSFSIGETLFYKTGNTYIEGIYTGKRKVTLTKIKNGLLDKDFPQSGKEKFDAYFKKHYVKIMYTADKTETGYNWEGSIKGCPIKMIINLAHGRVLGGHIKLDALRRKNDTVENSSLF